MGKRFYMKLWDEFKTFALKGNVLDMAVGVIIGAAFGKIVSSFVNDIIMPAIGFLAAGIDFRDLKWTLREAVMDSNGVITTPAVTLNWGNFIQVITDFIIITVVIFSVIKLFNSMHRKRARKKAEEEAAKAAKPVKSEEVMLLEEIRDLLKNKE